MSKKTIALLLTVFLAFLLPQLAWAKSDCSANRCGRITKLEPYEAQGSKTAGVVTGAVVGGLLGNQIGGGSGKKVATVGGAIAGGVAGHKIEENRNDGDSYDLVVEMDNGRRVTISQRQLDGIREGDRVYVSGGRARLL